MTLFKKHVIPTLASLSVLMGGSAFAQTTPTNDSIGIDIQDQMFVVKSSTSNYGPTAHPLAPGIIVKYFDHNGALSNKAVGLKKSATMAAQMSKDLGVELRYVRQMSGNAEVLKISDSKSMSAQDIQKIAEAIHNRPEVEYAEVDALMVPYLTPSDSRYNEQWHYSSSAGGMNLPGAWDITTGSPTVTVAVLDTGYRPHADLAANVVGQYDMISDTSVANDGGGRDSNAQDPGDWVAANECGTNAASNSSWHGTHVAGTVAAVSDNNSGVAGVAWNINLVPVRVLGKCGGLTSDIIDAIRWAAGISVSGVPANPNPADVINMSLGSSAASACSTSYQNAIADATAQGTTVVVAAGNDNSSSGFPPANCNNTISVAAGGQDGSRAYYSNFGSTVDITGPGGDGCNPSTNAAPTSLSDCAGNVFQDATMILSTHNSGTQGPGADSFGWLQGTSMASPHIAGLAALIKSADSTLTPAEVKQVIQTTADPFASVGDHQCTTSICGAGYANAAAAIASVTTAPPPPPGNNQLTNGVSVTGISGATGSETRYTLEVPAGATNLNFALSGGSGDADMYVRFGSEPTTSTFDCRPFLNGNNENCPISNIQAGTYHVLIRGYNAFSNTSLVGSYTEPSTGGGQTAFFQNGTNINIPDNNSTGITSSINVNRTGNAGTVEVIFDIVHTWRGDLVVDLIAPTGGTASLHARTNSGDSADNLSKTVSVNASSVDAAGEWKLRVKDLAGQDTGFIDSWSIEFQ